MSNDDVVRMIVEKVADQVADAVLDRVAERLAEVTSAGAGIVDERVYPPEEAAALIGLRGDRAAKTIREIPPDVLPRQPLTPEGKKVGFLGRDLRRWNLRKAEA